MKLMETSEVEYIALKIMNGEVWSIEPSTPQTQTAVSSSGGGNARASLAQAVAKLAEYGYRLVPGVVIPGGTQADSFIFMEREK